MTDQVDKLYKAEDGSALRFFWKTDRNNFQSEQHNRPVHDNVLYVEVYTPGSRESSPVHEVLRKFDKDTELPDVLNVAIHERYPAQIKAFLENDDSADLTGTPLESVTFLEAGMIASLKESKIFTVEGLAALPDEKLRVLGLGGRTLRDQAKAFLETAKGGEGTAKLAAEVNDLKDQIAVLTKRATDAETRVAELEKEKAAAPAVQTPPPPPPVVKEEKAGKGGKASDLI